RHAVGGEGGDLLDALAVPNRELLDLDLAPKHRDDMLGYVKARLRARDLGAAGPGKTADQAIDELAKAIVAKARNSFLVASIAARTALPRADGLYDLPAEVGDALSAYLDRLPDPRRIRDVLRPLAWPFGPGLPWGTIWPKLAKALATAPGAAIDDQTIKSVLDAAGDLVVESSDAGEPVYRLFHEALAENLRATTPPPVVGPTATAKAFMEIRNDRPWPEVPRYVRSYLPAFLSRASMLDELSDILLDPVWARQRRIDTGDSLAPIHDVNAGAALFAQNGRLRDLVPLCHQYSRGMVQAFPPVIEVLALSGQHGRAEALAANVTDVADRMLAFRGLAKINGSNRNFEAARHCSEEVERTLQSMHVDHHPMAWCWSTEAAMAAGLTEH